MKKFCAWIRNKKLEEVSEKRNPTKHELENLLALINNRGNEQLQQFEVTVKKPKVEYQESVDVDLESQAIEVDENVDVEAESKKLNVEFAKLTKLIEHEDTAQIQYLIEHNTDMFDKKNSFNCTVLHVAAGAGMEEVVKSLLKYKPHMINTITSNHYYDLTPLDFAIVYGHIGIVKILLDLKPKFIDMVEKDDSTLLHHAVYQDSPDRIEFLLHGTPFWHAPQEDSVEIIKLLLKLKPELINMLNKNGQSAFYMAALCNNNIATQYLQNKTPIDDVFNTYISLKLVDDFKEFQKLVIEHSAPRLAEILTVDLANIVQEYILNVNTPIEELPDTPQMIAEQIHFANIWHSLFGAN